MRKPAFLLNLDDELAGVAAELRVIALALDSRNLDIDRKQTQGAISLIHRQIDRLDAVRGQLRPTAEDATDEGGRDDDQH